MFQNKNFEKYRFFLKFHVSILLKLGMSLTQLCLPTYTNLHPINLDFGIKVPGFLFPRNQTDWLFSPDLRQILDFDKRLQHSGVASIIKRKFTNFETNKNSFCVCCEQNRQNPWLEYKKRPFVHEIMALSKKRRSSHF